jgi:hypothetical protein
MLRDPHLQPGRGLEVDAEQHFLRRVGVEEVEPHSLRRGAGEVDRVALPGSHRRPESHEPLQTRVREAPAATITFSISKTKRLSRLATQIYQQNRHSQIAVFTTRYLVTVTDVFTQSRADCSDKIY